MKLIEAPINKNLDLENLYPNVIKDVFEQKAIKFFKLYALDRTQIVYADTFDKIYIIMINEKKKITESEVDFTIKKLLHTTREKAGITIDVKKSLESTDSSSSASEKDIIIIQREAE